MGFGNVLKASQTTFYSIVKAFRTSFVSEILKMFIECLRRHLEWRGKKNNNKEMKTFCWNAWMAWHYSNWVNFFNGFFSWISVLLPLLQILIFLSIQFFLHDIMCNIFLFWKVSLSNFITCLLLDTYVLFIDEMYVSICCSPVMIAWDVGKRMS